MIYLKTILRVTMMADQSDNKPTTLSPDVIMHRNQQVLENSDFYKKADPSKKIQIQTYFYNKYVTSVNKQLGTNVELKDYLKQRAIKYKTGNATPIAEQAGTVEKMATGFAHGAAQQVHAVADAVVPLWTGDHTARTHKLDKLYDNDNVRVTSTFQDGLKDTILKGAGETASQVPLFMATDGMVKGLGLDNLLGAVGGVEKLASSAIKNGAQGYLIGKATKEDPKSTALSFAIGGPAFEYLGKLFVWGGGKLVSQVMDHAEAQVGKKAPEAVTSIIATAMAGSEKQKISAAAIAAINEITGGKFSTMTQSAKAQALKTLAAKSPEMAEQAAIIDRVATAYHAAKELQAQRQAVPAMNDVLGSIEKMDGSPTHVTIADQAAEAEKTKSLVNHPGSLVDAEAEQEGRHFESEHPDKKVGRAKAVKLIKEHLERTKDQGQTAERVQWRKRLDDLEGLKSTRTEGQSQRVKVKPGAASIGSLEFETNMSRRVDTQLDKLGLGKDKVVFEDRGHKLLFYLNALTTDNRILGPSKARNMEFRALMEHLHQRYPSEPLSELLKMSDAVWTKLENLTKAGLVKEGEPTRFFRQSHLKPGESPFAHEVDLLQQAAKADDLDAKLKAAFKSTKAAEHQDIHKKVLNELFPGKNYNELTNEELGKVNQEAAKRSK
jgi:hypothetical protein